MESIKNKIFNDEFEIMEKNLKNSSNIHDANQFLTSLKIDNHIKVKDFLSSFIIFKFPEDTLGDIKLEENKKIHDAASNIFNSNDDNVKNAIINFAYLFNSWKNADKDYLIQQIFFEYHQLTLDILNTPSDEKDKIIYYEQVKDALLEQAQKIGGTMLKNEIMSYTPIVVDVKELKNQYNKAFWNNISEEYNNNNFEKIAQLMNFFKESFKNLAGEHIELIEETFNIDNIIEKLKNNSFYNDEIINFGINTFDIIKSFQAPIHDMTLESFKMELHVKEIFFPKLLKNIFLLISKTIEDLDNIKSKFKNNNH